MFVCLYVCLSVYAVCMHVYMSVHTYACMYVCNVCSSHCVGGKIYTSHLYTKGWSTFNDINTVPVLITTPLLLQDLDMYHVETDTPALARTSNLNEELGQVIGHLCFQPTCY